MAASSPSRLLFISIFGVFALAFFLSQLLHIIAAAAAAATRRVVTVAGAGSCCSKPNRPVDFYVFA